ncbi:peroxisomal membrane protein receptor Pex19, putative [Paecilomyces variotii No. 5]|uniref:Peroxisomal membrane protein receptor Pex19, putative n=1 Tax=Byssochlamys spectabilis (strain No. 5 / NBRC 109023) TaxID=1356009 RepID=V5GAL7_BYSSN|nr:peroxisomal membrane protein receptor Pex19, putative [Paecilomyces variotii No. 5]
MEKETPVEPASAPDAATTQANTEPRSDSIPAPDTTEKAASNPAPNATASAAGAGDEEDSDWEELDEVLDDFNKPKPTAAGKAPAAEPSKPEASAPSAAGDFDEEAFLKQLEADMMANLMGGGNGTGGAQGAPDQKAQEAAIDKEIDELSKQLQDSGIGAEDFLKQLLSETVSPPTQEQKDGSSGAAKTTQEASTGAAAAASAQPESFQDTIRRTMERMQESGDRATAEATEEGLNDDMISQLLKAIEAGAGSGGEDMDLNKMFLGMMQQLSNKDLLYEPIKELDGKFGPWLEENKDKVPAEDMARYQTQARVVREIVSKFDEEGYSDDKPECRTYIWDRMQEMQAAGSPPEDLIANPLTEELKGAGGDGQLPPDCPTQ